MRTLISRELAVKLYALGAILLAIAAFVSGLIKGLSAQPIVSDSPLLGGQPDPTLWNLTASQELMTLLGEDASGPLLQTATFSDYANLTTGRSSIETRALADWSNIEGYAIIGGTYAITGYVAFGPRNVRNAVINYIIPSHKEQQVTMTLSKANEKYYGTLYEVIRQVPFACFVGMTGSLAGIAVFKAGESYTQLFSAVLSIFPGASPSKPESQVVSGHDELKKRDRYGCQAQQKNFYPPGWSSPTFVPIGWDMKMTCRKYSTNNRDEDLIEAGRVAMSKMLVSDADVTTFTVYNPYTLEAHARCSFEYEPFSYNSDECPYSLPGDKDGNRCAGCTRSPQHVNFKDY